MTECIKHVEITHDEKRVKEVKLPLMMKQMVQLQKNDSEARKIVENLHKEKTSTKMFILHNGALYGLWTEERETFH